MTSDQNCDTAETIFLDVKGLRCPMPLLKAKQALNRMQPGQRLQVEATDPGSVADFQTFCRQTGHQLEHFETAADLYRYTLVKSGA